MDITCRTLSVIPSGCPVVPLRTKYVPLLCGIDTDLRYYVIRDVIVFSNTVLPLVDTDLRYYVIRDVIYI